SALVLVAPFSLHDALPIWVVQLPVLVAFAGEDRAGVATSRRAHCCRGLRGIGGEQRGMVEGLDCAHGEGLASGEALVAVPMTQHRRYVGRISLLSWRPGSSSCLPAEVLQCWCSAAYRLRRPGRSRRCSSPTARSSSVR